MNHDFIQTAFTSHTKSNNGNATQIRIIVIGFLWLCLFIVDGGVSEPKCKNSFHRRCCDLFSLASKLHSHLFMYFNFYCRMFKLSTQVLLVN